MIFEVVRKFPPLRLITEFYEKIESTPTAHFHLYLYYYIRLLYVTHILIRKLFANMQYPTSILSNILLYSSNHVLVIIFCGHPFYSEKLVSCNSKSKLRRYRFVYYLPKCKRIIQILDFINQNTMYTYH